MYAVIDTGGKQWLVEPGIVVQVEKLPGEVGSTINFDKVLLWSKGVGETPNVLLGKPLLKGAAVTGEVVSQGRGDKILMIKYTRRKQYRRTRGHRQEQTQVLITAINNGAGETVSLSADDRKKALSSHQATLTPRGGVVKATAAKKADGPATVQSVAQKATAKAPKAKTTTATAKAPKKAAAKA